MHFIYKYCRITLEAREDFDRFAAHAMIERYPSSTKDGAYLETHVSGPRGSFATNDEAILFAIDWAYNWIDEHLSDNSGDLPSADD